MKIYYQVQIFIDVIKFKLKEMILIIQSFAQCENITVSMMKSILSNHKCTPSHFIILNQCWLIVT